MVSCVLEFVPYLVYGLWICESAPSISYNLRVWDIF